MSSETRTEAVVEAIEVADANLNNVCLPTYTELLTMMDVLVGHVLHYASMPHAHSDAAKDAANARALIASTDHGKQPRKEQHDAG